MSTESESEQVSPAGLSAGGGGSGPESSTFSDIEVSAMTAALTLLAELSCREDPVRPSTSKTGSLLERHSVSRSHRSAAGTSETDRKQTTRTTAGTLQVPAEQRLGADICTPEEPSAGRERGEGRWPLASPIII